VSQQFERFAFLASPPRSTTDGWSASDSHYAAGIRAFQTFDFRFAGKRVSDCGSMVRVVTIDPNGCTRSRCPISRVVPCWLAGADAALTPSNHAPMMPAQA